LTGENTQAINPQPGGRQPAPGELGLLQAFLNSRWDLNDPRRADTFASAEALGGWLASHGLIAGSQQLGNADLDRVVAVREGLRALAFANNDRIPDERMLEALRRASRGVATQIRIEPEGPRFTVDPKHGTDAALAALFAITARAMIDGSWSKLKACPGRHCGWVFYDHSRNQSARWCSMKVCGDREKSRAYYRRKTAGGG
jgi:predicted RNA-binding Zn ribbon-like protein